METIGQRHYHSHTHNNALRLITKLQYIVVIEFEFDVFTKSHSNLPAKFILTYCFTFYRHHTNILAKLVERRRTISYHRSWQLALFVVVVVFSSF